MSSPSSSQPSEWTVIYHGSRAFKGRGEFLQLMLEDAGITNYEYKSDDLYGPSGMMDLFRGETIQDVAPQHVGLVGSNDIPTFPMLAPPALMHRPPNTGGGHKDEVVVVSQVGACMIYLGDVLGYAPQSIPEKARANAIMLSPLDYISEGRRTFHPIKDKMSYNDQKEEGDKVSKEWSQTRMKIYLGHFNKLVEYNNKVLSNNDGDGSKSESSSYTKPIAGGPSITYADFALFHVLHATEKQFNTSFYDMVWDELCKQDIKPLQEWYEWMKSRPNLVAYLKSDRAAPFSGNSMM